MPPDIGTLSDKNLDKSRLVRYDWGAAQFVPRPALDRCHGLVAGCEVIQTCAHAMKTSYRKRQLLLNISPVVFKGVEIKVGIFEFEDDEDLNKKLDELRDTYYETHVFRREGSRIICVPTVEGAELLGDSTDDVSLSDNLRLSAVLIREALINHLHQMGRQIHDYVPIELIADRHADLLTASVPEDLTCPPWLSLRPRYEIDVRVIFPGQQPPFIGAVLNVRTKRLIERSCDELIAEGFPINGLYVGVTLPKADKRVQPRLCLVGRVLRAEGKLLVLDDVRDDNRHPYKG